MNALYYQVEEYCRYNCIDYHMDASSNRVLINNEFCFDLKTNFDVRLIKIYIDIISGKNEIVNMICDKLNISVTDGCSFKLNERCQSEDMCVSNNTFILTIDNLDITWYPSDKHYTAYDKYILFTLKICVSEQVKYYLIKDNIDIEFSKELVDEKLKNFII